MNKLMTQQAENKFTYYLGDVMYINVTNLCTNQCEFCIRSTGETVGGVNLVLDSENFTAQDIINEFKTTFSENCREIVFCGYGEPLIKLEIIKETAGHIKKNHPGIPVRINSNGHANLVHKKNIVPELKGLIDEISVSLNSDNAEQYALLCHPAFDKDIAYQAVKDFITECVQNGIKTTATVVSGFKDYKINLKNCKKIAKDLGAQFRVREWLPVGYD